MNAVQKYLIERALDAAREAAGALIATNQLSPVLVAQSLEELTGAVERLEESTESNVPCDLEYTGFVTERQFSSNGVAAATTTPIFVKPSLKV